ncbi:hypothetical protein Tsp_10025 [Trichinella spiralis]|nr:hypothetical protein Tsp_10025 [Trichinella spiralis]
MTVNKWPRSEQQQYQPLIFLFTVSVSLLVMGRSEFWNK